MKLTERSRQRSDSQRCRFCTRWMLLTARLSTSSSCTGGAGEGDAVTRAGAGALERRRRRRGAPAPRACLEPVEPLDLADEVVLEVQDAQVAAQLVQQLDALDALLVQRNLLQRRQPAVVVLGAPDQ